MTMGIVLARVYNHQGYYIASIMPDLQSVSWRINEVGTTIISLPYNDSKCTTDILKIGNLLYIQFQSGLEAWGGVMALPFDQDTNGVRVTVYSGEDLLRTRRTSRNLKVAGPPGLIFNQIIDDLNATAPTVIEVGATYNGGVAKAYTLNHTNPLSEVRRMVGESGEEWALLPYIDDNERLRFTANWYAKKGVDRTHQVHISEGASTLFTSNKSGEVISRIYVIKPGSTWGEDRVVQRDHQSARSKYGLREGDYKIVNRESTVSVTDAAATGDVILDEHSEPLERLVAQSANFGAAQFADYKVGDIVLVTAFGKGGVDWGIVGKRYRVRAKGWQAGGLYTTTLEQDRSVL